jgi:Glu-tRNA(Gln) amidotransferase subunit E-like FAD-binding protein
MEKAWRVSMLVWNKNRSSKDGGEVHKFIVLRHTEEDARMRTLLDAAIEFPPDEGWSYDIDNATVEELSREEVGDMIDELRKKNMEESQERMDKAMNDLKKQTGVDLRAPKTR